jgi:intermediate peptidase
MTDITVVSKVWILDFGGCPLQPATIMPFLTTMASFLSLRPALRQCSSFISSYSHAHGLQRRFLQSTTASGETGLFSISGLQNPHDFLRLTKEAIHTSDDLRASLPSAITSKSQAVNVLYQLDQISKTVCNVIDAAELCRSAHASAGWRESANAAFMELQDYIGTLNTDKSLYDSLAHVHQHFYDDLTEEEQRFCTLLKQEFEIDGIHLPEEEREKVKELHHHVTTLETLFANNITNSQKHFHVDSQPVESVIPRHVLEANGAVYDSNHPNKVQLTADSPISHSISSFANDAGLRKQVHMESMNSCPENIDVLEALVKVRRELAHGLGYESYSHRFLQDKMAQTPENVNEFLQDVQQQIAPGYRQEMELISRAKQTVEGGSSNVEPWDVKFYVKLLKAQLGGVDPHELADYLSLSNCLNAMQLLVLKLFGIKMQEQQLQPSERWDIDEQENSTISKDEQIRKFVFWEEETGRELGTMYLDLHPRAGKYTHAAHFTVRCGCVVNGPKSDYQLPIVALVCNMSAGQASFSSHQEVETLFHEFGHALHSLLSRTNFQHLAGTRGPMDFVETPSHWMEHYVWDEEFLPILAQNERGDPIPESLLKALVKSRNQFRCLEMQNQIVLSTFDQQIFGANKSCNSTQDIWATLHRQHGVPYADGTHWYTNVGHLVTYGAGYYGYLYSQVFASSIWSKLFHKRSLKRDSGEQLWKKVLIHGGSRDPSIMLEDLIGKKPTVENHWNSLNM